MLNYKNTKFFLTILITIFLIDINSTFSQNSTPLEPDNYNKNSSYGFFVGLGQTLQSGSFKTDCQFCNFEGGTGFSFILGGLYEQKLSDEFNFGSLLFININKLTSSYQEKENLTFQTADNQTGTFPAYIKNKADLSFTGLNLTPYIKISPVKFFFVRAGLNLQYLISNNIIHTQSLTNTKITLSDGTSGTLSLPKGEKLQDSEITLVNKFQTSLNTSIGINFNLSKKTKLCPIFNYNLPINNISDFGSNFKLSTWYIIAELRINLDK